VFLPEIFPDAPIKPLRWVTSSSSVERSSLGYSQGTAHLEVYVPTASGPHGAVLLMLGARPIDQDDPVVTGFADGLSRLGVVVMVPASDGLAAGRIAPDEIDLLVNEFLLLRGRTDVDPDRVGFIGLSVGASLALVAAADERIRDKVKFVNAFGGYFDAHDLFVAIAARSLSYAGEAAAWEPAPLAREVMVDNLVLSLPSENERDCIRRAAIQPEHIPECETAELSPQANLALELLSGPDTARAEVLVQALMASTGNLLQEISPRAVVHQIHADIFVMHDLHDHYIPYTESRRLVAALPESQVRGWTELELFEHVMPGQPADPLIFAQELALLFRHVYLTFLEVL
jgi:dienelactone hydrolase